MVARFKTRSIDLFAHQHLENDSVKAIEVRMTHRSFNHSRLVRHMKTDRSVVIVVHLGVPPTMPIEPRTTVLPSRQEHTPVAPEEECLIVSPHQITVAGVTDIPVAHTRTPRKAGSFHGFRSCYFRDPKSHTPIVRTQNQKPTLPSRPTGKTWANDEGECRLTRRETRTNKEHPMDPSTGEESSSHGYRFERLCQQGHHTGRRRGTLHRQAAGTSQPWRFRRVQHAR